MKESHGYRVVEPIDLAVFNIDDRSLAVYNWEFRNVMLKYKVYRLKVRNKGRSAAQNCKGVLNDGEDKKFFGIPLAKVTKLL